MLTTNKYHYFKWYFDIQKVTTQLTPMGKGTEISLYWGKFNVK